MLVNTTGGLKTKGEPNTGGLESGSSPGSETVGAKLSFTIWRLDEIRDENSSTGPVFSIIADGASLCSGEIPKTLASSSSRVGAAVGIIGMVYWVRLCCVVCVIGWKDLVGIACDAAFVALYQEVSHMPLQSIFHTYIVNGTHLNIHIRLWSTRTVKNSKGIHLIFEELSHLRHI